MEPMSDLLTIGDFSRMTFLTVKALRHYHEVGLLEPARIDEHSGYRYYRPEQLATARLIRRLRDLDLPVEDVRTALSARDEQTRNAVIVAHLERMRRQLLQTQETVDSLRRMLSGGEQDVPVVHRTEPGGWAVAVRGVIGGEEAVAWWLDAFQRAAPVRSDVGRGPRGDRRSEPSRPSSSPRGAGRCWPSSRSPGHPPRRAGSRSSNGPPGGTRSRRTTGR